GYVVMHSFDGAGSGPAARLIEASDGRLYGTTFSGGSSNLGTVFAINKDGGGYSVLYNFTGAGTNGSSSSAGLIEGSDGFLYGTTAEGGPEESSAGAGVIFRISRSGTDYRILATDGGCGLAPQAGLTLGGDGALYGTSIFIEGRVFRVGGDGIGCSVVHQ